MEIVGEDIVDGMYAVYHNEATSFAVITDREEDAVMAVEKFQISHPNFEWKFKELLDAVEDLAKGNYQNGYDSACIEHI